MVSETSSRAGSLITWCGALAVVGSAKSPASTSRAARRRCEHGPPYPRGQKSTAQQAVAVRPLRNAKFWGVHSEHPDAEPPAIVVHDVDGVTIDGARDGGCR